MTNTETLAQVYADNRWGRPYLYKSSDYAGGYHRGQDIRKQEGVYPNNWSVSHNVLALTSGKVVYVGRKLKIGLTIVIDNGRTFESHSHLKNARVKVNQTVSRGDHLADTDTSKLTAGTSWGGPHDHITFGHYYDTAWNTNRAHLDPRPIIREARSAPAEASPDVKKTWPNHRITTAAVNIRTAPNGTVKVTAPKALVIRTGKVSGKWAYIRTAKGTIGWMHRDYMMPRFVRTTGTTNFRATPDAKAGVVMKLKKGTSLTVLLVGPGDKTRKSGWRKVRTSTGREGWVPNRMLAPK